MSIGMIRVPLPVPSSLASKPSARSACATNVSVSKSMRPVPPCAVCAVATSIGPDWLLPPKAHTCGARLSIRVPAASRAGATSPSL